METVKTVNLFPERQQIKPFYLVINQEILDQAAQVGMQCFRCTFTKPDGERFGWMRFSKDAQLTEIRMRSDAEIDFPGYTDFVFETVTTLDPPQEAQPEPIRKIAVRVPYGTPDAICRDIVHRLTLRCPGDAVELSAVDPDVMGLHVTVTTDGGTNFSYDGGPAAEILDVVREWLAGFNYQRAEEG